MGLILKIKKIENKIIETFISFNINNDQRLTKEPCQYFTLKITVDR